MKILGIHFAPLFIPLERRLQTASVFFVWNSFLFFQVLGLLLFLLLLFSPLYFLALLYLAFYVYDYGKYNKGGRRFPWLREWKMGYHFSNYFPIKMVKTADLDPSKNYIFGYHPHGIMCIGGYGCFCTESVGFREAFPGIKPCVLTLEGNFRFPFHRDYLMALGVCSVSKESVKYLLTQNGTGNALVIVVGGAAEALNAHPGTATLVLKSRKGFLKAALGHGASLVPVFSFGENDVFDQIKNPPGSLLRRFQEKFKEVVGFSLPLMYGRGVFQYTLGLLPHRKPVTVVVGAPIDVDKIPEPTPEDLERVHRLYVEKLTELYETHKDKYAPDVQLDIT